MQDEVDFRRAPVIHTDRAQNETSTETEAKALYVRPVLVNMGSAEDMTAGAAAAAQIDATAITADS
jgi:hypothetical protein